MNDPAGGPGYHPGYDGQTFSTNRALDQTNIEAVHGYGTHSAPDVPRPNSPHLSQPVVAAYSSSSIPTSSYGVGDPSTSTSAYSAYASSTPLSPPSSSVALPYAYGARTPQDTQAAMRRWERRHIYPRTQQRLQLAAQTVLGEESNSDRDSQTATSDKPGVSPGTTTSTTTAPTSSSYLWRSLRWSYLQSYPATSWNTLYQRLFESVATSAYDAQVKAKQQEDLLDEFGKFTRNVVELIMEEVHLPAAATTTVEEPSSQPPHLHTKFLAPLAVGGVAGGEKYILNGVFFKFARDWAGLFSSSSTGAHDAAEPQDAFKNNDSSSDEFVQKSAANEIRHMNALIEHDSSLLIHAPLFLTMSCLYRLRGSVVMCTALAPIQGKASLVYGSADAGHVIHVGEAEERARRVAQDLAAAWHLATHPVVDGAGTWHQLPLATDIEIHVSRTDGRMYMLDLARFLPPTTPTLRTMEHLYCMFRPEFMRRHVTASEPISADAFSGFGNVDSAKHNGLVMKYCRKMKYELIPETADALTRWWKEYAEANAASLSTCSGVNSPTLSNALAQIVHEQGVNMRYLGLIRAYLPDEAKQTITTSSGHIVPSFSTILLYEMVTRTLKQMYFGWVRFMMLSVGQMNEMDPPSQVPLNPSTATSSTPTDPSSPLPPPPRRHHAAWTDLDLERWQRRIMGLDEMTSEEAAAIPMSTSHHESSVLFAMLLGLLFASSSASSNSNTILNGDTNPSFYSQLLWPTLLLKYFKSPFGSDWSAYEEDVLQSERVLPQSQIDRQRHAFETGGGLLSQDDMDGFEKECKDYFQMLMDSNGDMTTAISSSSITIFIRMLYESVGMDFYSLRHALSRQDLVFSTPSQLLYHIVSQECVLRQREDEALTPTLVTLWFLIPFQPTITRVRALPFVTLAESEATLKTTLEHARRQRMKNKDGENGTPYVTASEATGELNTLWALLELYQAWQRDEEEPSTTAATPTKPPSSGPLPSSNTNSRTTTSFSRGEEVLQQIECIFDELLKLPSPSSTTLSAAAQAIRFPPSYVDYSKFGWFYLKFGRLAQAKTYFEKDYTMKLEIVRDIELIESEMRASSSSSVSPSSTSTISPALSAALLRLARASEACGIITRELGDGQQSLTKFQECLQLYQRLYGKEGIGLQQQNENDTNELDSESTSSNSSSSTFRHSIELATLYTNLANSYGALGDLVSKRRYLEAALSIMQERRPADGDKDAAPHPNLISIQMNLASCLSHAPNAPVEEMNKAKTMLEECIAWTKLLYPSTTSTKQPTTPPYTGNSNPASLSTAPEDEHFSLASIYTTLANVVGKLGDHGRKVELLTRALALSQKHYGLYHPEVGVILTNLGLAQAQSGEVLKGLQTLQQALQVKTKVFGSPIHNEVAITLTHMSVLYQQCGDFQQEFKSLQQALQIFMTVLQNQAKEAATKTVVSNPTGGTPLPTSASSLATNPHLLFTQQRFFRAKQALAQREQDALAKGCCSFTATGTNRSMQSWFKCLTCSPNPKSLLGVCVTCSTRCHAGHDLQAQDATSFYCDCGEGVFPKPCQALEPRKEATSSTPLPTPASATLATSSAIAPISTPPATVDPAKIITYCNSIFDIVQSVLKANKLAHYTKDCTKDLLLLHRGLRISFIVDVFAPPKVWLALLDSLTSFDSSWSELGVLDLCEEGCVLFHRARLQDKLVRDAKNLTDASNGVNGGEVVEFVNVQSNLKEPQVLIDDLRQEFRQKLLVVIEVLIKQLTSQSSSVTLLQLPSLSSSKDASLTSTISSLSLTTVCGYLLHYPVLYCMVDSSSPATSSLHRNNLSMKPLLRHVVTISLRSELLNMSHQLKFLSELTKVPTSLAASSSTTSSTASTPSTASQSTLIYSFTVPASLITQPLIQSSIRTWQTRSSLNSPATDSVACWNPSQLLRTVESVTLPVVAL